MNRAFGVLLFSLTISLLLGEWALRTFYPTRSPLYEFDERMLYRLTPGTRKLFIHHPLNGGARVWVRINSEGFRGDELRKDASAVRIAVYGDSFIMGEFSRLPDTFAKQLEQELFSRSGRSVEVINAGVVGYGPDQAYLRMKDELPSLKPRLIVLALFADNDLGDLLRNKRFRLTPEGALMTNPFVLADTLLTEFRRARWPLLVKMVLRQLRRFRPEEQAHTPEAYRLLREREYNELVVDGDNIVRSLQEDTYDADVALDPNGPSATYKVRLLQALLAQVGATAREAGVPVVVLVIPSPIDVCDGYSIQVDPERHPVYRRDTLTTLMTQAARDAGLPHLNLYETFRANSPDDLYFRHGDDHWNTLGQHLAARTMAEFISAMQLLDEGHAP